MSEKRVTTCPKCGTAIPETAEAAGQESENSYLFNQQTDLSLFFSSADDCVIAAGSDLINDTIKYSEYRKAAKCYHHIQHHIIKGKHFQDL